MEKIWKKWGKKGKQTYRQSRQYREISWIKVKIYKGEREKWNYKKKLRKRENWRNWRNWRNGDNGGNRALLQYNLRRQNIKKIWKHYG